MLVRGDEFAADAIAAPIEISPPKTRRRHDLGEFLRLARPVASHDVQRFALRRQPRAAADSRDGQRRQREADVQALRLQFEIR